MTGYRVTLVRDRDAFLGEDACKVAVLTHNIEIKTSGLLGSALSFFLSLPAAGYIEFNTLTDPEMILGVGTEMEVDNLLSQTCTSSMGTIAHARAAVHPDRARSDQVPQHSRLRYPIVIGVVTLPPGRQLTVTLPIPGRVLLPMVQVQLT